MNTPASKSTEPSAQIVPAPTQPLAAPVESALPPLAATAEDDSAAEAIARALAEPARTAEEAVARPLILVVHASVGSGHRSAANAIAEALEEAGEAARAAGNDNSLEARSEVRVLDILDFGRIVFDGDKTASMFTGWTRPFYDLTWALHSHRAPSVGRRHLGRASCTRSSPSMCAACGRRPSSPPTSPPPTWP